VILHDAATTHSVVTASQPLGLPARLEAIDLVRGVVMVLMALDHVRDFLTDSRFNVLDLSQTTIALFLTRWVTHFCAPVFVFLAGTSAFLFATRGKTKSQLVWFLLTRGLWLVVLEFSLVHLGWFFSLDYRLLLGQVIWAIGWSMVALAGLVFLPTWAITTFGVALIACHNVLDPIGADRFGAFRWLWVVLRSGSFIDGPLQPWPGTTFFVAYPLLPWLGIMTIGYGCGRLWLLERGQRRLWLLGIGTGLSLVFIALRATNWYGDAFPWAPQATSLLTLCSFMNCQKYPPSLLFVLMTLGPAMLLLGLCDRAPGRLGRVFVVFGRVPLFYYLLHLQLIHLVALGFAYARYGEVGFMLQNVAFAGPGQLPARYGYGLPVVYAVWLGVVVVLYPACSWFAEVKYRRRAVWLSYL
jgi:uncharacterized membrane protein